MKGRAAADYPSPKLLVLPGGACVAADVTETGNDGIGRFRGELVVDPRRSSGVLARAEVSALRARGWTLVQTGIIRGDLDNATWDRAPVGQVAGRGEDQADAITFLTSPDHRHHVALSAMAGTAGMDGSYEFPDQSRLFKQIAGDGIVDVTVGFGPAQPERFGTAVSSQG